MAQRHYRRDWVLLNHPEYKSGWKTPKPERVVRKPIHAPRDNAPGYISTDYKTLYGGSRENEPLGEEPEGDFFDAEDGVDAFEAAATHTGIPEYSPVGTYQQQIGENIEGEEGPWTMVTPRKSPKPRVVAGTATQTDITSKDVKEGHLMFHPKDIPASRNKQMQQATSSSSSGGPSTRSKGRKL